MPWCQWQAPSDCSVHRGHFPGCFMVFSQDLNLYCGASTTWLSNSGKVSVLFKDVKTGDGRRVVVMGFRNSPKIIPWQMRDVQSQRWLGEVGPVLPNLRLFKENQKISRAVLALSRITQTIINRGGGCLHTVKQIAKPAAKKNKKTYLQ